MANKPEWEEIESEEDSMYWNPEKPGDCIEGTFQGFTEGDFGDYGLLDVEGEEKSLPGHINLNGALKQVNDGDFIRICLTELRDVGRDNPKRIYRVFRRK